jgi:hypothetical protein
MELDRLFRLRPHPDGQTNQARQLRIVRQLGQEFAQAIVDNTPVCADQSAAVRSVRQAVLWANEAILREVAE